MRLFSGFFEGLPELVVDIYGRTLLLHDYAPLVTAGEAIWAEQLWQVQAWFLERLPWIQTVVLKQRQAGPPVQRGRVLFGECPDHWVRENGVRYAIDLLLNRDASLYLDTRLLRAWAKSTLAGTQVLNTFAYTGSLGVAALAGGAQRVIQLDRNRTFLNLAKTSYTLNGFCINKADFLTGDFFTQVAHLKNGGQLFDCVFVDPPFFSTSGRGTIDLLGQAGRVINKVRPLVRDQGWLVAVNNAVFLSGADYMRTLQALCEDGYLSIETLIPVPEDILGRPGSQRCLPPVDPAPFNHATKIAVLRVRRKA